MRAKPNTDQTQPTPRGSDPRLFREMLCGARMASKGAYSVEKLLLNWVPIADASPRMIRAGTAMFGPKKEAQGAWFYAFSIEGHVPQDNLLRSIDRFVDLSGIVHHLTPFNSDIGRPSIDPELLIRRLLVWHCLGIRTVCRITRSSPRTAMAVFATATCCAARSRRLWRGASRKAWSAANALRRMPA